MPCFHNYLFIYEILSNHRLPAGESKNMSNPNAITPIMP